MSVDTIEKAIRAILVADNVDMSAAGASGSVDLADMRLSLVDGAAFVDFSAAGALTPFLNQKLTITDSAGKKAIGYIHRDTSDAPFVMQTYASSGSSGIRVADNDNIDFGTGNFTLVWKGALPDWTPSVPVDLVFKRSGSAGAYYGYRLLVNANGTLSVYLYRNSTESIFTSTSATGLTDGTNHTIVAVVTRETASTAGSVVFYVDAVALGSPVAITAAETVSISNTGTLHVSGNDAGMRFASVNKSATLFNRALTAAEVLDLYRNGIAEADKWGSQTPIYTSNFSAGVDGWGKGRTTVTGNIDGIGGEDDTLRMYASADNDTHYAVRSNTVPVYKNVRVSLKYYMPSTNTNVNGIYLSPGIGYYAKYDTTTKDAWTQITFDIYSTSNRLYVAQLKNGAPAFVGANSDTDDLTYLKNITVTEIGATLALEPDGINTTNWIDSSDNGLDASYPTTGWSAYPAGYGVRITSTPGGTTYNWTSIESGFNYNDASGYTYEVIIIRIITVKAITTRCYPGMIPQNPTYPLIVYYKVTGMRDHHLQGPSGLAHPRFQVEAWATTYDAAKALANAIRGALDGYKGTVGTVDIRSILIESERDFYEEAVSCHRVIMDFFVWHSE